MGGCPGICRDPSPGLAHPDTYVVCKFFVENFILYNQLLHNENAAGSLENLLKSYQNKVSVIF